MSIAGKTVEFLSNSYSHVSIHRVMDPFVIAGQKTDSDTIDALDIQYKPRIMDVDSKDIILSNCRSSTIISKSEHRLEENNNNNNDEGCYSE